ncbi:MAG: FKBP-type peptidyl-prolyl cis-trans isomerase [Bacteroidales bacterium]|nr:FKBP-type peptidyl-prolyl cis-trans isomerase [Bacteroidales bacterium]MCM1146534.1 FKBP-type peptidyl-prolyl cis-trans isomerase [Bacteroidales bacterium]MCM1205926.1 FKBP-type peptidyl-prolyl cis-trans isomerase [Bacillota bacterium]MCM1510196.1 FKBP-type peptidyl-prolyl cis-trans isomerase [Clostridium sp.]
MKKTITMLALAIVAGAACSEAIAKKDKKNKKTGESAVVEKPIVSLQSKADSVSYAAGKSFTAGMMPYVTGQLNVDTAYIADFLGGLRKGLYEDETPQMKAEAAGRQIAQMVKERMMPDLRTQLGDTDTPLNEQMFKRAFADAVENDNSVLSLEESSKYFEASIKAINDKKTEAAKAKGKAWLEENAKKDGVKMLPSGLQYKVITEGNGPVAKGDDDVVVKYEGKLIDGTVFDSSYTRNPQTTTFKPGQVIKGWTEALCMMPQGSVWELYIPENLGYGGRSQGKIPAYSTLIFKVEVVEVKEAVKDKDAKTAPVAKVNSVTKKPASRRAR